MTAWRQNLDVAWRLVEGRAVLVHPADGQVRVLNETGTRVWGLLEAAPVRVDPLVEALVAEFEVDEPTARADLVDFLEACAARGLVESG
ncbi:MAG: PqqD family protein [Planctomycetes bacterium]|nr:PqqD family protein [Planctomycetota bacterium]